MVFAFIYIMILNNSHFYDPFLITESILFFILNFISDI